MDEMQYYSLSAGVKDKISSNDEIWHIVRLGEKIYFQSFTGWYSYDGKAVSYMDRKRDSALCIFILVMIKFMLR